MSNPIEREPTITEMRLYRRMLDVIGIMTILLCLVFWNLDINGVFLGFFTTVSAVVLFELLVRSHITKRLIEDKKQKNQRLQRLYEENQKTASKEDNDH